MATTPGTSGIETRFDYTALNKKADTDKSAMQEQQDAFLKLLVKQLQSQDPMNPMDNAQMTSQMAQINTVTGIEKLNAAVQTLLSSYSASHSIQAAGLVGKQVMAPQDTFAFDPAKPLQAGVTVPEGVTQVGVAIIGEDGKVVDQMAGTAKEGEFMPIEWDGTLSDGTKAKAGNYFIVAKGLNADGKEVNLTVNGWQQVKSVEFGKEGVNVNLASGKKVGFDTIQQVM
ncbi:flagellar hook assembly protein FlgD [Chitiniphilus purpureus]|uniref:Basal-body rod modification protein FlgD n=1 Tax=Chitiniphilus purpureus TaxID=2981137 RepID=A0ABY6DSL9_9NEIS|nr:flagellar hook assembly protein FlgD [Chitiniphilus sp. CD1]UXY17012.1 flagellar hook assembly protein FlgD [Chitiniphilus sp. CD1]